MLPDLIYLDRYRNQGTRVYSPHAGYTDAQEPYRPDSRNPSFDLPTFRLPAEAMKVYEANPAAELRRRYLPGEEVLFPVHPQLLAEDPEDPYLQRVSSLGTAQPPIPVSPSSSTRTLYVLGHGEGGTVGPGVSAHPTHALKVHFPFRISRYGRRMRDEVVEQAINVSREMEAGISSMSAGFAFLREVLGVTHPDLEPDGPRGENWGYLVRDMTPFPIVVEERVLVPGFSLYGGDFFDPDTPPLILELLADSDPRSFILEKILLPIVRHWVECFLTFGFILEPHGQNVLLDVGKDGAIQRIVHRDLSPGIDMRRRRELGIPDGQLNAYNRMNSGAFASIAYDRMMGGHFFDHLLKPVLENFPGLKQEDFRGECRSEFGRLFPEHQRYLPRTVQYFSETRDEFGKPLLQDTGEAPAWRP